MVMPLILDVVDVVALERAVAASGTSLATLMERAGHALATEAMRTLQAANEPTVVVLAGTGNNGGDGWVAAGALAEAGFPVVLLTPKAAGALRAEPAREWALRVSDAASERLTIVVEPDEAELKRRLREATVAIDGMLGTGFSGTAVREPYAGWIAALDAEHTRRKTAGDQPLTVIAADVPSGVSAQTGAVAAPSVKAETTVTMIVAKPGLFAADARAWVGGVVVSDLGIDAAAYLPSVVFRHAVPADLEALLAFYDRMIEATTGTANDPLWLAGTHPSRAGLTESIALGELLVGIVVADGSIAAAAVVDQNWNPGYDQGAWSIEAAPSEVWTLHLVAVDPCRQHAGLGRRLVEYAARQARAAGGAVFRIDVLASNTVSLEVYEALGFHRVGPVDLDYEDPRVKHYMLFEKSLSDYA